MLMMTDLIMARIMDLVITRITVIAVVLPLINSILKLNIELKNS